MLKFGKNLVIVIKDRKRRGGHRIACFGAKRHYTRAGSCHCVESVLAQMKPWHRSRTKLDPWGGKQQSRDTGCR